jgi:acyl carrier protein
MIQERIKAILSEQFGVEEDFISNDTDFVQDLSADSLDIADLLSNVESELEVEIDQADIDKFKTVGDLIDYVEKFERKT